MLVFCLIHFWRLKRGATIIGQNSERQGGPSCYCGKYWEAWAVMAAKSFPVALRHGNMQHPTAPRRRLWPLSPAHWPPHAPSGAPSAWALQRLRICCSAWSTLRLYIRPFPSASFKHELKCHQGCPSHIFVSEQPNSTLLSTLTLIFLQCTYDYLT